MNVFIKLLFSNFIPCVIKIPDYHLVYQLLNTHDKTYSGGGYYKSIPSALGKVVPHGPEKWKLNSSSKGSSLKLNSATGFPLSATVGANMAAGYTTEEVPITRQRSQVSTNSLALSRTSGSKFSPNQTIYGLTSA
jgi:hypothetical protein